MPDLPSIRKPSSIITRRSLLLGAGAATLASPAQASAWRAEAIWVQKGARLMHLVAGGHVFRTYGIGLGFDPVGHKRVRGDGRTPEGRYRIDRRNPRSAYHLSLGVSYPNADDRKRAARMGRSPGGDIFIHGEGHRHYGLRDWTKGCIAVTNREIEEIWRLVPTGIPIRIDA